MTLAYLDTSAYVKTIVEEPESEQLERWLEQWPERASCGLLRTEAVRAVRRYGPRFVAAARGGYQDMQIVRLDDRLLDAAADLALAVRSLDAIHLAAALALGPDLGVLVTYDERMQAAAEQLRVPIAAP